MFGDIFESQETIDELKDISDEIKKYDVYDVLARISGLNLMPYNQNKSILLDSLIADIIWITSGKIKGKSLPRILRQNKYVMN